MDDVSSPVRLDIPDVVVYREGGLALFCPISHRAVTWIEKHIPPDAQWLDTGLVVRRRYADDLAKGMKDAGLRCGEHQGPADSATPETDATD